MTVTYPRVCERSLVLVSEAVDIILTLRYGLVRAYVAAQKDVSFIDYRGEILKINDFLFKAGENLKSSGAKYVHQLGPGWASTCLQIYRGRELLDRKADVPDVRESAAAFDKLLLDIAYALEERRFPTTVKPSRAQKVGIGITLGIVALVGGLGAIQIVRHRRRT